MKKYLSLILLVLAYAYSNAQVRSPRNAEELKALFLNAESEQILVCAHRGDWRNAPENSLQAVQNCMEMGVDIVEVDIRKTKDDQLILMHDRSLDRTTTGKGKISDWLLADIKDLRLKNGAGMKTDHKVPTLEELMLLIKGKPILVNLDKAWDNLPLAYAVLKKTGTLNQAIFKGNEPLFKMREQWGAYMDSIMYMPMVWPEHHSIYKRDSIQSPRAYTQGFYTNFKPVAFEVIIESENSSVLEAMTLMKDQQTSIWINTLWSELCAGHYDDLAQYDPELHWGWVIKAGAQVIQTDRPAKLLDYLRTKGLHP
ncbi:glycerophosphodiester phosphodiesterase family protein [Croceimicrobium hydrocarbonivorans]|uniref:Glycerophosphodiester phosphodiesterase family protein n=1 Tax=Croceimicrobium hydrocarbonivorans TaxID=2761580 RepID=A0A7H0VD72_9FLAO|nr:glycerophosphodiester phosphodiesterase family protein [Croceimicrobium hydrocarbonivorans]QNR23670.1 glycerophosphodiester phosphodiesterase family protein [Croceimicrobium hydrocarbonivorans]